MDQTTLTQGLEKLKSEIDGSELSAGSDKVSIISVPASNLLDAATALNGIGFDLLHSVSGVDFPDHLQVVYHLFDTTDQSAVVLKAILPRDNAQVPTVTPLWVTADWHEREAGELYGIEFLDHPDPMKLLLAEDYPGFPLRKDWAYPDLEEYLLKY